MQLNFLQEDLLEILQQGNKAAPVALSKKPAAPQSLQTSLLTDEPAPMARKKPATPPAIAHAAEEKAASAFKTISEAAKILAVPAYVLRFWESQFPQISPTKSRGGRRYYRPEDMDVLASIKNLLYKEGYTIKGARKAFGQLKQDVLSQPPVPVQSSDAAKPLITPKQKAQLSAVRSELLNLRDQLSNYLPA